MTVVVINDISILALLPLVARDQLGGGPITYGVLMAGFGALGLGAPTAHSCLYIPQPSYWEAVTSLKAAQTVTPTQPFSRGIIIIGPAVRRVSRLKEDNGDAAITRPTIRYGQFTARLPKMKGRHRNRGTVTCC
ncbi:MFS transporter [Mesorhizobium tamadayense]|uniref:MFS transporter n=1 Tax=Mesorhizobium tamadayense TaxID=425306 RepID=UPI001FE1A51F|nr:MFS transporter [Mesorhizobium tamadayense]